MDIFTPFGTATTALSTSNSTASAALTLPTGPSQFSVRVFNAMTVTGFIQFGGSTVTAATTNMPIPAGGVEVFQIGPGVTHAAAITASGSGTIYFTPGMGA